MTIPEATIKAKGPTGKFSYNDKVCSNKLIATVSGSGRTFKVLAGGNVGRCTVVFTDKANGQKIGSATLYIKNTGI